MVDKLSKNPKWKFTYAEVSFFSLWWNEQSLETRKEVSCLIFFAHPLLVFVLSL